MENNVHHRCRLYNEPLVYHAMLPDDIIITRSRDSVVMGRKWCHDCGLRIVVEIQKAAVPHMKSSSLPNIRWDNVE